MPHRLILALTTILWIGFLAVPESDARTLAVRIPRGDEQLGAALQQGAFSRWILPDDKSLALEVGPEARGDTVIEARFLPGDEALRQRLAGLPIELQDDAIVLDGTAYREPRIALALRVPQAEPTTFVVIGRDVSSIARLADQILIAASGRSWHRLPKDIDYLVWEHSWSHRSGRWRKTEHGFTVDPEERDDMATRARTYAALNALTRRHVVLRVPAARVGDTAMKALADELDGAVAAMAPRLPLRLEAPIEVIVESDFAVQGRHLGDIGAAVLSADGRLHIVFHPDDGAMFRYGLARALIRRTELDLPPWLEDGAALWLSRGWYGRDYDQWLSDLIYADVLPRADELLAEEHQGHGSNVLWPPVAAAIVERLRGSTATEKLGTVPGAPALEAVLSRLQSENAQGKLPAPPSLGKTRAGKSFLHGVSLAMANGLDIGYHAPGVDEQLVKLAAIGADSVSLMPFAYQRSPGEPELHFLNRSPSSETDVGVIHAARRAHARGFSVLWKPHIWVSHNHWPGDIAMRSEDDWRAWWRNYRSFILHHAVLAQATGSEMLALGVELGQTVGREDDWRFLIRAVRRIYGGSLTYAGNWWGDYDKVPFWDALDAVGVDAYFPLAHEPEADRAALVAGARRAVTELATAAERFGKPVILTEVGFAARRGAWMEPHQEGGDFSETDQTAAYDAFLDVLGRPAWLHGMFVWKVFSHPRVEGGRRPDFRFLGRGAENVVRGYFNAR